MTVSWSDLELANGDERLLRRGQIIAILGERCRHPATVARQWRCRGAVSRHSDNTNLAWQRRKRVKLKARGLEQCNIWVPPSAHADIHLMAELLQQYPHLLPGPLRDPVTGEFVALRPVRGDDG
jgi:hypothetical protein